MVSLALGGAEKTKKSFKEKTCKKSICVGTEMAMSLLGKLHEIECHSCLWDQESASKREAPCKEFLPTIEVQEPPPCSKPLSWIDPRPCGNEDWFPTKISMCNPTSHHFDTCTSSASPGKAANGTLGSHHHNKYINAGPGKALNSKDTFVCCNDELPLQCSAKRHQAEGHCIDGTSLHRRFKGNNHPKIWPANMMSIISSIVKSHSPCPGRPLFNFE
jgi:hypothetical protein